ncbi:MAG: PQQ-binding-like beta-propeller repeat protein [Gemmatimonadetes bacterium]|nr:PQQ-binding-like beta-propeller repeat protein [Gemmatimonadota bacterium]
MLAVPERPVGALAEALQELHDPRGAADLDARLGELAAKAPAGSAFIVARDEHAWIFPSEQLAITRVRPSGEELLTEPQVIALEEGESVDLRRPGSGAPVARMAYGSAPVTAGPIAAGPVPAESLTDAVALEGLPAADSRVSEWELEVGHSSEEPAVPGIPADVPVGAPAAETWAADADAEDDFGPGFGTEDDDEEPATDPRRRSPAIPVAVLGLLVIALGVGMWVRNGGEGPSPRVDAFVPSESRETLLPDERTAVVPEEVVADPETEAAPVAEAAPAVSSDAGSAGPWTFVAGGAITSSPVVVGDRIVFGCRDSTLYCLNAVTGREEWAYPAGSGIGSSPCASRGVCFVGTYGGRLLAVDLEDGSEVWTARTGGKIVSSPCVIEDLVVVGSYDRAVHGFDRKTGEPRWMRPTGSSVRASPEPIAADRIVIGSADGGIYCLDLDGSVRWKYRAESPVLSAAAYDAARDLVVVGAQNGSVFALAGDSGELIWRAALGSEINGQPRFADSAVLLGTGAGRLVALDPASGEERWRATAERGFDARPLLRGDTVIAPSFDGTIHLLALTDGERLGERKLAQSVFSSPAEGEGLVYVGTLDGEFHALRLP